jgi:hypothetical protein
LGVDVECYTHKGGDSQVKIRRLTQKARDYAGPRKVYAPYVVGRARIGWSARVRIRLNRRSRAVWAQNW